MVDADKIFVISFPGNDEHKKKIFYERVRDIPTKGQAELEILRTPDKSKLTEAMTELNLRLYDDWASEGNSPMTHEEISMAIGHWRAWKKAQREHVKSILVLEEGFISKSNHYHVLDTSENWEMVYLARQALGPDMPLDTGGLVVPGYSIGSFAYLMTKSGIEKVLKSGYDHHIIPAGEFLTAMHNAHPRKDIRALFPDRLAALAPMKNLIQVDERWSTVIEAADNQKENYVPLHPQLFDAYGTAEPAWIKRYINAQLAEREFDLICDEPIDNVYSFPLFTPRFCKELVEEAEHFGQWTNYRHKNSPPIDIMLSSFGFDEIYSLMLKKFLFPLVYHKYQLKGEGWNELRSQNFIVRYVAEQQGHLGLHNDGSYLSMIVTLNKDFEGGGTIFPKFKKLIKPEQPGYACIHPGLIGYIHGARPVTRGRRYILASFFFPGSKHPMTDRTY